MSNRYVALLVSGLVSPRMPEKSEMSVCASQVSSHWLAEEEVGVNLKLCRYVSLVLVAAMRGQERSTAVRLCMHAFVTHGRQDMLR